MQTKKGNKQTIKLNQSELWTHVDDALNIEASEGANISCLTHYVFVARREVAPRWIVRC